jgi:nitrate/nitrite transporter NarK
MFAFGNSFMQLVISRLLLSSIGAGFVIGIKMTDNWFPPKYIGRAEGFYAGWGNFGSAAAAGLIPIIGLSIIGGEFGWRWSMAISSIVTALYGVFYYFKVKDFPTGKEPIQNKNKKVTSVLPVSSYAGLLSSLFWTIPLYAALGLLASNLQKQQIIAEEFNSAKTNTISVTSFKNVDAVQVLTKGGINNFYEKGDELRLYAKNDKTSYISYSQKQDTIVNSKIDASLLLASRGEVYRKGKLKIKIDKTTLQKQYNGLAIKKKYTAEELKSVYKGQGINGFYADGNVVRTYKNMFNKDILYIIWAILGVFYIYKAFSILKFNIPRLKAGIPEEEKYPFSSVAALNTTYFANFGAELAVVSMLPMFFEGIFNFTPQMAGVIAMSFAFVNLFARPLGGYLSDKMGSRKKTMLMYMIGITLGFFLMGLISKSIGTGADGKTILAPMFDGAWWIVVSVIITMFCSMFVQGAEGATFAMIPSIKKDLTGRIAGMAGAYGNVGAVAYLFILTQVDYKSFFFILSVGAAISVVACYFLLKEPKGSFGEGKTKLN